MATRSSKRLKTAGAGAAEAGSPAPASKPAPKLKAAAKKTEHTDAPASSKASKRALEVGKPAPDFSVPDQDGNVVTLSSFKGQKHVCVFFYPKDNTPGCTKESCTFRDLKAEFDSLDSVILGVSADHQTSHGKFIAKFGLNFSLLADTDRALIKAYGASKAGDKIQRSTVLVDKEGLVAALWNPVQGAEKHPNEVLAKLRETAA